MFGRFLDSLTTLQLLSNYTDHWFDNRYNVGGISSTSVAFKFRLETECLITRSEQFTTNRHDIRI